MIRMREELLKLELESVHKISDAKSSILSNFFHLLELLEDFSDYPELEKYSKLISAPFFIGTWKNMLVGLSVYRLSRKLSNEELKNFECDCCRGVTTLYKTVYQWLVDFICEPLPETTVKYQLRHADKNMLFKGDTMTSVFTPIKEYIKLKYGLTNTHSLICSNTKPTDDWESYWAENIWHIDISKSANEFIYRGYSFANFLPVPQGFNTGRSNFGKWDSWDLTLAQIYQWYLDNPKTNGRTDDCALEKLFKHAQNRDDVILHCTQWLKNFYSWENFVEQNYMQAFILPDGRPKKFFKNHTLEYGLPKTLEEYEEFFENVNSCIEERGDSINKYLADSCTERREDSIQ